MILGEIRHYLRDNNTIRVSRSLRDLAYRVLQTREALLVRDGREPTVEQIAGELGQEREEIVRALEAIQDPISLFEPVFHDGTDTLAVMDQVKDESDGEEAWLGRIALKDAMGKLSPPRAAHPDPALLPGPHPDGGRRRDPHLPGSGQPPGKGRPPAHAQVDGVRVGRGRRARQTYSVDL